MSPDIRTREREKEKKHIDLCTTKNNEVVPYNKVGNNYKSK